jgi:hypothetical protein
VKGIAAGLVLVLSGCLGGGGSGGDGSLPEDVPSPVSNTTVEPPPVNLTDTLHLMGVPEVALAAPTGDETIETPLPFGLALEGVGDGSQDWEHVAASQGTLDQVSARVWVRLTQPTATFGEGPLCQIAIVVVVFEVDDTNGVGQSETLCGRLPVLTQPGDYEFELGPVGFETAVPYRPGMRFQVEVGRYSIGAGVGDPVLLLSGSAEFDSYVRLHGLAEVVPS